MSSLGELRSVTNGEHKVYVRSVVIKSYMLEGDDPLHLPIDKMPVTIDGGPATVRQVFTVGSKSDHVIIAVEIIPNHRSLFFVAYKLIGGVWQQQDRMAIDPEGNLKELVKEGVYNPITNVHRHLLRCCS